MLANTEETLRTDEDPQEDPAADRAPDFIREIDWTAGHGVARAFGYITLAAAYGVKAELLKGGTHSGRIPLTVAVYAPENTENGEEILDTVNDIYDVLAAEAEKTARDKREAYRKTDAEPLQGYAVNRFSRAILAGFLQGAAGVLKTERALKTESYRLGTRARAVDENAHRTGLNAGRTYARTVLIPQLQQEAA